MAKEYELEDLQFIETSAKTGVNVKQLFKNLATNLPGIQSTSGKVEGYAASSSTAVGEGGSAAHQERFKLTASGAQMSARQRS